MAQTERGTTLTIFAVLFAILAVSNLLKPLQIGGEDGKEGAAGIRRVELHTLKAVDVVLPRNPHPEFGGPSLACLLCFRAIALTNDHIAAVPVAAFQESACCRIVLDRCDNFKEI